MNQLGASRERKAWKAFQADYDYVFSQSDRVCSYCLSDQDTASLLAMTEYLKWSTRWVAADGEVDSDLIESFTDRLERRLMSGCCDDNLPIQYRYTEDGVLQRSLNAGGTWADSPEYDVRVTSPQFPPMPGEDGDDKRCIAATGAAALVEDMVDNQITEDMTRFTLSETITAWTKTYLETSNPFLALLTVISNQIFALVLSALLPALTDEVYDEFQCAIYCNISDAAQVNDLQWQAIRTQILEDIPGIAGIFLEHLIYLLGTQGTTNLCRAGGALAGDCEDCGCGEECDVIPFIADGENVVIDGCNISVDSHLTGSVYSVYLWFGEHPEEPIVFDPNECGQVAAWTVPVGSITQSGWNECVTGTGHTSGFPLTTTGSQFFWASNVPFTLAILVAAG